MRGRSALPFARTRRLGERAASRQAARAVRAPCRHAAHRRRPNARLGDLARSASARPESAGPQPFRSACSPSRRSRRSGPIRRVARSGGAHAAGAGPAVLGPKARQPELLNLSPLAAATFEWSFKPNEPSLVLVAKGTFALRAAARAELCAVQPPAVRRHAARRRRRCQLEPCLRLCAIQASGRRDAHGPSLRWPRWEPRALVLKLGTAIDKRVAVLVSGAGSLTCA